MRSSKRRKYFWLKRYNYAINREGILLVDEIQLPNQLGGVPSLH
jgi:hypothetical protein